MKFKRFPPILRWLSLLVLVALVAWYGHRHPELFAALGNLRASYLGMLVGLALAARLLRGQQFRLLASALGVKMGFWEAFGLVMCSSMYSYLAPGRPGLGAQAFYLKSKHDLSYAHFGSLAAASNLLQFLVAALAGLAACLVSQLAGRQAPPVLVVVLLVMLLLCLGGVGVLAVFANFAEHVPTRFLRSLCTRMGEGIRMFWQHPAVLAKVAALGIVTMGARVLALWVACAGVGLSVGLAPAISMFSLAWAGLLLPLTPGGLGVSEGAISAAGHLWGLPADTVALAAVLLRAAGVAVVLSAGGLSSWVMLRGVTGGESAATSPDSGA